MSLAKRRSTRASALAGLAVLALAGGALPAGDDAYPLKVVGIAVEGASVGITVHNLGDEDATGTVVLRAVVAGRELAARRTVAVSGAQKAFVEVVFPCPVDGIIDAAVILDDGSPF